jgi:hypothetical protein
MLYCNSSCCSSNQVFLCSAKPWRMGSTALEGKSSSNWIGVLHWYDSHLHWIEDCSESNEVFVLHLNSGAHINLDNFSNNKTLLRSTCFSQHCMSLNMLISAFCSHIQTALWTAISFYSARVDTGGGVRGQTRLKGVLGTKSQLYYSVALKASHIVMTFSRKWSPSVMFLSTNCEATLIHAVLCFCVSKQGAQWQQTFQSLKVINISSTSYVQIQQVLWLFQPFNRFWKFYLLTNGLYFLMTVYIYS